MFIFNNIGLYFQKDVMFLKNTVHGAIRIIMRVNLFIFQVSVKFDDIDASFCAG